jgi:hypothetical protein
MKRMLSRRRVDESVGRTQTQTLRYFTKRTCMPSSPEDTSSQAFLCKKLSATYRRGLPILQ